MKILRPLFITVFFAATFSVSAAPEKTVIKIGNGITQVDFTGDGVPDLIISGHRENYNAHSFDVVSFYVPFENIWNIVPIFGKEKEEWQVSIGGGADCLLQDFRLLKGGAKEPATLITADRELGESYVNPAKVTFTFYKFTRNKEAEVGEPTFSFIFSKAINSKVNYCDVGNAFKVELNLGPR